MGNIKWFSTGIYIKIKGKIALVQRQLSLQKVKTKGLFITQNKKFLLLTFCKTYKSTYDKNVTYYH